MTGGQPDCQETNDDKSVGQAPFFPEEHFKFLHSLNLQRSRITLPLVLVCIKEMEYLSGGEGTPEPLGSTRARTAPARSRGSSGDSARGSG